MKKHYILSLSVLTLSISTIFGQSPLDDGTIVATQNFNAVTVPATPSNFFTYGSYTSATFKSTVNINAASDFDGTGLGVAFNYDAFLYEEEEIFLHTFTNVAPGDYIIQYEINAESSGFGYQANVSDGTNTTSSYREILSGEGTFQKRYTSQIALSSTGDITFSMFMSPFVSAFIPSNILIDNIELIKMNAVLPTTVAGATVEQEENYDTSTTAPPSSGPTNFTNSVMLSQDADVNNTGLGVEFKYGFVGDALTTIDFVTFSNVPAGTYYIDYQVDDNYTSTSEQFSYYNQITDGTTTVNNYIVSEGVAGFIAQRTHEITTTATGNITLKWIAQHSLNNTGQSSNEIYLDNVRLLKVPTTTLNVNSLDKPTLELYPNPSSNYINISGLQQVENFTVYSLSGHLILKGTVSASKSINIENLSNGMYVLKLENNKTIKFIKE